MGFFDAQAAVRNKQELLRSNSVNKLGTVSPETEVGIIRKIYDGDTLLLNSDVTNTRLAGIDTYEIPHDNDWLLNPYNQKRMEKQREQLSAELGRPVTNEDVFNRGLQDKQKLLTAVAPAQVGNLPILANVQQNINTNPMNKSPHNNYGRNLGTVTPLVGGYTAIDGKEVLPTSTTIGRMPTPRSASAGGFFSGIDPTKREEYTGAVDGYSFDLLNIGKQVVGGIVSAASSVSKSPKKLYELLGGDYLEDDSAYSKSVKSIIEGMDRGGRALDKIKEEYISPDDKRINALRKQVGKAFDEGNYVTGILGAAIDNPAGAVELAASMYGFSKAMGAKGLTGTPVIAGAFTDNADQARQIFIKEYGREPDVQETATIATLAAIGTAVDTAAAKFMFSKSGGDKAATALTATVDNLVARVPNSVARVALGSGAKVATIMGTEGIQEGTTEATTVLGGTQDLDRALQDKYLKQVYEASALGALSGPGMHVMNVGGELGKEGLKAVGRGVDQIRTTEPMLSAEEKREVELAGGTVAAPTKSTVVKQTKEVHDQFNNMVREGKLEEAKVTLDETMQRIGEMVDNGEIEHGSAEYVDARNELIKMHQTYQKNLGTSLKTEMEFKDREYPRMAKDVNKDPEMLGAKKDSIAKMLQEKIDYGVMLDDESVDQLDSMTEFFGLDKAKVEQYKKEREALKPFTEESIKAMGKDGTERKSLAAVTYESMIGPQGVQRIYERMKAAEVAGDTDAYAQARNQLGKFKATQQYKYDQLAKGIKQYEETGENVKVAYSTDAKYTFTVGTTKDIKTKEHAINAANRVLKEIEKTITALDTVTPKEGMKAAEVKKPAVKQTEKPVEAKKESKVEKVQPKAEEAVEELTEDLEPKVKVKVKAKADKDAYSHPLMEMEVSGVKKALKDLGGIKAQSVFKNAREQDKYIEQLGTVEKGVLNLSEDTINTLATGYLKWVAQDAEQAIEPTMLDMARIIDKDELNETELGILSGKGILRKNVVQALGQMAAENLEMDIDKDMPFNVRQNIATSLGNILLSRMLKEGTLIKESITPDEWNMISEKQTDKSVEFVRFNPEAKGMIKQVRDLIKQVPELSIEYEAKEPVYGTPKRKKKHEFRKRPYGKISEKDEERLSAQERIAHNPKTKVYEAFNRLGEWRKTAAGWKDEKVMAKKVHKTKLASIKAVNRAIERSLENLDAHMEKAEGREYYFNYFMSGNGRDMIDSNTFNPQSDKLHRHMDYTGKEYNPFVNERNEYLFKIAVLQGMDVDVDKMPKEDIMKAWNEISDEVKRMSEVLVSGKPIPSSWQKKIAEYAADKKNAHTIDAMVALGEYINASKMSETVMLTNLQVEVDAVTSGWIIALMQNPAFDMETNKEYLAKGGVYIDNPEAVYQNRVKEGYLDSYETVMEAVKASLGRVHASVLELMKVDRKFAKAPFMTHVTYGAGIGGVKADIVNQFIDKLYQQMVDDKDAAVRTIYDITGKRVNLGTNPREYMLDAKTVGEIKKYIDSTYGKAVENALSEKYKAFTATRDVINNAFQEMFQKYETEYAKAYAELEKAGPITKAKLDAMERDLSKYIPTIMSPNGTTVQIFSKEKMAEINEDLLKVQTAFMNDIVAGQKSVVTTAERRRVAAAKAAGGVVPIHFIDGSIIGEILKQFQMTGIYDAGMFNAYDVDKVVQMYNEKFIEINKSYSLLGEVLKAAKESGVVKQETLEKLSDAVKVADKNRAEIFSSNLNVQHFALDGIAYRNDVKAKESNVDYAKELGIENEKNVEYLKRVAKMTPKQQEAIMSVLKMFKDC